MYHYLNYICHYLNYIFQYLDYICQYLNHICYYLNYNIFFNLTKHALSGKYPHSHADRGREHEISHWHQRTVLPTGKSRGCHATQGRYDWELGAVWGNAWLHLFEVPERGQCWASCYDEWSSGQCFEHVFFSKAVSSVAALEVDGGLQNHELFRIDHYHVLMCEHGIFTFQLWNFFLT